MDPYVMQQHTSTHAVTYKHSCSNMQRHTPTYEHLYSSMQRHAATYRGLYKKLSLLKVEFTFSFEHVLTLETQDLFRTNVTALTTTKNKL